MDLVDMFILEIVIFAIMLFFDRVVWPESAEQAARIRREEFSRQVHREIAEARARLRRPGK